MKFKHLIAIAALTTFAACETSYRATDSNTIIVSDQMRSGFTTQYPTATNVVWYNYDATLVPVIDWDLAGWTTMDAGDYLVRFDVDSDNYYAWYDSDGAWVGTAYVVKDHNTLPSVVSTAVYNQFPGYSITSIAREFQRNKMAYEIELTKDNSKVKLLVDTNGYVLKQKTKKI